MDTIKLLHISDIHFPEAETAKLTDMKDSGFPPAVADIASLKPLQSVVRKIQSILQTGVDAILFCGDLTSKGDLAGYSKCVQFLSKLLRAALTESWIADRVFVVPGNHDVNRAFCDPTGNDILKKFLPLVGEWSAVNLNLLSPVLRDALVTTDRGNRVAIYSVNSCIGCQEKRLLPNQIRDDLHKLFEKYIKRVGSLDAFDLLGEQIDTPAFVATEIEEIAYHISDLGANVLPVVIGHHNLLSQTTPRTALYTELINGGQFRSRMMNSNRPVIYCHGHVHDDPLEIIKKPSSPNSQLLCISAPQILVGFNMIEIIFGSAGMPIGCAIKLFRLGRDGDFTIEERRVPLQALGTLLSTFTDRTKNIIRAIPSGPSRFMGVFNDLKRYHINKQDLAHLLLEYEWFGVIKIENRSYQYDHWQIERLIP
jgi:hypothetical protein